MKKRGSSAASDESIRTGSDAMICAKEVKPKWCCWWSESQRIANRSELRCCAPIWLLVRCGLSKCHSALCRRSVGSVDRNRAVARTSLFSRQQIRPKLSKKFSRKSVFFSTWSSRPTETLFRSNKVEIWAEATLEEESALRSTFGPSVSCQPLSDPSSVLAVKTFSNSTAPHCSRARYKGQQRKLSN